ncbi:hypothetical protein HYN48_02085 [Flavobacterium magnum]|uniref:Secretion system C-terminal sorting domain-containing protein n=1 Tax=Flavobacterium magnum TaxID=2162713 RepID=A0A2S0RCZ5_9FLAO|nr:T9SS type A sorting domain-containing protein [Flavobacterium magnum]AWA28971.1 hypothetical protein HYN48_02085 [Flavobacterium magnum]
MKKLYTLLFVAASSLSFGQLLTDDFNYADAALLTDNGWANFSGNTNAIDVGASNGLSYAGYSGVSGITGSPEGNAALLDNNGEDVKRDFTAVTSGTVYYSVLVNVTAASEGYFMHLSNGTGASFTARLFVRNSATAGKINFGIANGSTASYGTTDYDLGTTYLLIVKCEVATAGTSSLWVETSGVPATEGDAGAAEATSTGGGQASVMSIHLRQFNVSQNITIDGLYIDSGWFGNTPPPVCPLALGTVTKVCDAITSGTDTYTVTIPFTGGATGAYSLNSDSGTIGGDDPNTMASGNIVITGISEGTAIVFTAEGGDCNLTVNVTSPDCAPAPAGVTLPYTNNFAYPAGAALSTQQDWTVQSGTTDEILVAAGNLDYTGIASVGNSIAFDGTGIDNAVTFDTQNSGTVYYSFLLNVASMTGVTDANGGYFAGLGSSNTSFGATLWTKAVDDTNYNLGLEVRTANAANTSWSGNYATGETLFVVVGYTFGDAATASDDTASLWINPAVGGAQTAATVSDSHTGADLASINRFFFRQDSATETPALNIDALRIGTTWESVTESNLGVKDNNIAGLKVYPNPVSNGTFFIETAANAEKAVVVYDVLGKQVVNTTTTTNAVNVSKLTAGVYIVKITEAGNTATRKMVIK